MADKVIRYGAGGVPYVEKTEDKKSELIQEILEVNPIEEDVATEEAPKKDKKKKKKEDE